MEVLSKFIQLPSADRRLLVGSVLLMAAVRLGLWLLPFQLLRRLLAKLEQTNLRMQPRSPATVDRIVWSVKTASRYVPAATCLTQALTAKTLLTKSGHPSDLRIGVAKVDGDQLEAHAWVESQGKILIGNLSNLDRYTRLPSLRGDRV